MAPYYYNMSFKEYLTEEIKANELVVKLFKECRPYIEELRKVKANHFFYRGSSKKTKDILKIKPRTDRYPKDMPDNVHNYIDEYFYKKFRWRPRSEGVFTSFRRNEVLNYGTPHLFFPIGRYQYIYSSDVEDLYGTLDGRQLMEYIGDDEIPDWIYREKEWEYNNEYGEESNGGSWFYEDKDTEESIKTDAVNVAAEAEGIDLEDEDAYYRIEDRLEWVASMTYEDYVEEVWAEKVRESETELDDILSSYVQSKNISKAADDGYQAPEVMWLCKEYYIVDDEYEGTLVENLLLPQVRDFKNTIERIDKQMLLPFKWSKKK